MQVNIALLTVTDTRTIDTDKSGAILVKKIKEQNHKLVDRKIVKDEKEEIKKVLSDWLKNNKLDVIITTGGTGGDSGKYEIETIKETTAIENKPKAELKKEDLKKENPGLITARISGYGQTGPKSHLPGYASVCEGFGGFRYVNGFPDRPPVRPNLSIGDTLAGLHAALGVMLAYIQRQKDPQSKGQVVDTAIYESVFNMMEAVVPEYSGCGAIREPSGSTITGIVPTNTYLTADDKHVIIGGNGDSIFKRLMVAIGRPEMAEDKRFADNMGRVEHEKEIDAAIEKWTREQTSDNVLSIMDEASVPAGPIYSVEDMMNDEHYIARGMFQEVEANGRTLHIPAMTPVLTETPGGTEWSGPELSEHTHEVLSELLGKNAEEIKKLGDEGIL